MAYPHGLPAKYREHWDHPWTRAAARSGGFRRWLKGHGYLTPHFTKREARSHDGRDIPRRMATAARDHAFRMERLRHALGDHPLPVVSWYRSPQQNTAVHGARDSQHIHAVATDVDRAYIAKHGGQTHVGNIAEALGFHGIGTYPGGNMHFDSRRGPLARWSDWIRT